MAMFFSLNFLLYFLFVQVNKMLMRYFDLRRNYAFRINATDAIQSTNSTVSMATGVQLRNSSNETESESDAGEPVETEITILYSYVFEPFNILKNIKMALMTCTVASTVIVLRLIDLLISRINISTAKLAKFNRSKMGLFLNHYAFSHISEYVDFLKEQQIYHYLKYAAMAIGLFSFLTSVAYVIKVNTAIYKYKLPFYHLKVYLTQGIIGLHMFIVCSTLITFIKYKMDGISFSNGTNSLEIYPTIAVIQYTLAGIWLLFTAKNIENRFVKELRKGLFTRPPITPNNNMRLETLSTPILYTIFCNQLVAVIKCILVAFICFGMLPVAKHNCAFDKYLMALICYSFLKNRTSVEIFLFKMYILITRLISRFVGLDNYLFNRRLIKFDRNRLFWASNKHKKQGNTVRYANSQRVVTVSFDKPVKPAMEVTGFVKQSSPDMFKSTNSTITGRYEISTTRFIRYFGTNHKRTLTIVYKPKWTRMAILMIKMVCLLSTRLLIRATKMVAWHLTDLAISRIQFHHVKMERTVLFWLIHALIIKLILSPKKSLTSFVVMVYTTIWNPMVLTVALMFTQNRMIKFSELFYICSVTSSIVLHCIKTLCWFNGFSIHRFLQLIAIGSFLDCIVLLFYSTFCVSFLRRAPEIVVAMYLSNHFIQLLRRMFTKDFLIKLKDKYYLKSRVVVNYDK
ncbi:hypothetical protein ECANGB1_828 [Enterospora canceri]|uniref:Uncharacterized protein n=1 Tax=Enterospora canceri TaxID=1081671 RepID=A0A1Y1S7F6_9MICR|nr:hypothetical protein ECANGB1_828 [Enterospora canceri]